jgi:hypothetical protein
MQIRHLLKPKPIAAFLLLMALVSCVSLSLQVLTSQGHKVALEAIHEPTGSVVKTLGTPKRVILIGSSSRVNTINYVSRACGSNRYLVFGSEGWGWVEVTLYKRPNQWDWILHKVVLGRSTQFHKTCTFAESQ